MNFMPFGPAKALCMVLGSKYSSHFSFGFPLAETPRGKDVYGPALEVSGGGPAWPNALSSPFRGARAHGRM